VPGQSEFARISSATNFLGQQGEVRKVVTAAIDVTAYKQSEAARAASAELYNPESQALEIVAQRGFQQHFLDHFRRTELIARQSETAVRRYQQELQGLAAKILEPQEHESEYLARELHDVLSQKLAVLGREIAALGQKLPVLSQELKSRLQQFTEQTGFLSRDTHQISLQFHPAILDDLGLKAGLPCLYRCYQESLLNIGKHARAEEYRPWVRSPIRPRQRRSGVGKHGGADPAGERLALAIRSQPAKDGRVEVRASLHHSEP
jgi:signal transduction histidine kinase